MKNKFWSMKMKKIKKKIILIAVIVIVVVFAIALMLMPANIETVEAAKVKLVPTVKGTGYVEGDSEETIYASVDGVVDNTLFQVGDRVSDNSLLLTYTGEDQQRALNQAKTNVEYSEKILEAAKANRQKYQNQYDDAVNRDVLFQLQYAQTSAQIRELDTKGYFNSMEIQCQHNSYQKRIDDIQKEIADKQSKLQKIQYNLNVAELKSDAEKFEKQTKEAKKKTKEIKELNEEIISLQMDELNIPVDRLTTEEYDRYVALQQQLEVISREWAQARSDKDTSQSMLTALQEVYADEQLVAQSKYSLDRAQTDMERALNGESTSVSGIITQKLVGKGSAVEKGEPLFVMQTTNYYRVRMRVSKFDISKLSLTQNARISVGDKEYTGTVVDISQSAAADDTGKPKAYVDIKIDTDEPIIVGFEAEVTVELDKIPDALCVPAEALYSDDAGEYVYAVNNGVLDKVYVEIGAQSGDIIQIIEGLALGQRVAVGPDAGDYQGKRVR